MWENAWSGKIKAEIPKKDLREIKKRVE